MKKVLVMFSIACAALVALLAIPMVAAAEKVDLEGRGVLWAKGTGKAEIEGRLKFHGTARAAVLVVEDRAGDARIDVKGYKRRVEESNGRVRYVGFSGRANIEGSDVAIDLQGKDVRLVVGGAGTATLKGKGIYKVGSGPLKQWSEGGVTLQFDENATSPEEE